MTTGMSRRVKSQAILPPMVPAPSTAARDTGRAGSPCRAGFFFTASRAKNSRTRFLQTAPGSSLPRAFLSMESARAREARTVLRSTSSAAGGAG